MTFANCWVLSLFIFYAPFQVLEFDKFLIYSLTFLSAPADFLELSTQFFFVNVRFEDLTSKLPKNAPEFSDVRSEGDVCVQDDDLRQVGGQSFG